MAKRTRLQLGSFSGSWVVRGVLAGVALVGLSTAWFALAQPIQADEFGVRQIYFGPNRGVQQGTLYEAGLHLVIPGYERLHVFPRDLQAMDFNDEERSFARQRLGSDYAWSPSIRIQTSEGYQVTVDVTVLYRIVDPYTVLTKVGPGRLFETQVVQRRADKILRQSLGALNAEEFYDEVARTEAVTDAETTLKADLSSWGLEVWGVLLREYDYDDRYQAAIEERKIQDQRVFKNQAESTAATRQAERDRVIAEGRATIEVEGERGRAEVRRIDAEADLYHRQQIAEGDLLVALAEAKGTELENEALRAAGAANLVGLEMAEALQGIEVIIVSTTGKDAVNPLDLDRIVEGF
ncbi:MAG: SPFH domain-containing protein [Alphaproteobacteria bacterium]|nr:SPFH domain-containing protein [Alphaproteobacteria bacterium]